MQLHSNQMLAKVTTLFFAVCSTLKNQVGCFNNRVVTLVAILSGLRVFLVAIRD